jgi:hypothetical protein
VRASMLVVLAILAALALAGCSSIRAFSLGSAGSSSQSETVAGAVPSKPPVPATMPDLVGQDLQRAAAPLAAAGLQVTIVIPAQRFTPSEDDTVALAFVGPSGRWSEPRRQVAFTSRRWNHTVAAQSPPAGTRLSANSEITLTAGLHTGASPDRPPWVFIHGPTANVSGVAPCIACHQPTFCSRCHVGGVTSNATSGAGSVPPATLPSSTPTGSP